MREYSIRKLAMIMLWGGNEMVVLPQSSVGPFCFLIPSLKKKEGKKGG